jgi:hypothetical protein
LADELGVERDWVYANAERLGHTDPTLTLAVYQQVLDMGKGSVGLLEEVLGCNLHEARAVFNGEATAAEILKTNPEPTRERPTARRRSSSSDPRDGRPRPRVSGTNPEPSAESVSAAGRTPPDRHQKTPPERGFRESG